MTTTTPLHPPVRVLYIEDDPLYGKLVEQILGTVGCRVTLQENGADGVAAFQEAPFDIVAVDYRLPDMTGIEVCQKLRIMEPSLPLVIITGKGKASTPVEAFTIDVPHYLEKGNEAEFTEGLINTFRHLIKNLTPKKS